MTENIFTREGEWYKNYPGRLLQVVLCKEDDDYIEVRLFEAEMDQVD
ncbi:MAG: hypothetical protein WBO73_07040 [Gammaproteobacteria bacterium]